MSTLTIPLSKAEPVLGLDLPGVGQVGLVADEDHDYVGVGVLPDGLHPLADALEARPAGHIVDQERAHGVAVVGARHGPEAFLAGCVPNLRLDVGLVAFDLEELRDEFNPDGHLRVWVELVALRPQQQVRFAYVLVPCQHHLEDVVH